MQKKTWINWIFSVAIVVALYVLIQQGIGIFFETNDDKYVMEILSGAMTGTPDAHSVQSNYLLSLPLSVLYRLTDRIPWYGMFIIGLQAAGYVFVLHLLLEWCPKRSHYITTICLFLMVFGANLYIIGELQYTSTAIMAAFIGYICLILGKDSPKKWMMFFVLELLAYLLRNQSMLMAAPIGLGVAGGFYLMRKDIPGKARLKAIAAMGGCIFAIIVFGMLGEQLGYGDAKWREFRRAHEARVDLFDYYGCPPYEEIKDILQKYEVTQKSYAAFTQYVLLDEHITADCLEEIAQYQKSAAPKQLDLKQIFLDGFGVTATGGYSYINYYAVFAVVLFVLWIVLRRSRELLFLGGILGAAEAAVFAYLLYMGRFPKRVILPLLFSIPLFLLALAVRDIYRKPLLPPQKIAVCTLAILFGAGAFGTMTKQTTELVQLHKGDVILRAAMEDIYDYCSSKPNNRYLLDQQLTMYCDIYALDSLILQDRNCVIAGSWFGFSPSMKTWLSAYLGEDIQDIQVLVLEQEHMENNILLQYLEEKSMLTATQTDSFALSHGGTCLVYQFVEKGGTGR